MMANGDPSQHQQHQSGGQANNNPQSAALLQQYFGAFGHPNSAYSAGSMGANLTGDQPTTFLPFLPTTATNPSSTHPTGFPDFATHPYYHHYSQQNATSAASDVSTRPAVSPLDLKYQGGANGSVDLLDSGEGQTAASSTDGSSPFEASATTNGMSVMGAAANPFYNQFIQDNYLSAAMGAASDAYPSTSFMGMNPYSHPYYPYPTAQSTHHQNSAALSSAAAMDLMQSPTMFGQWKYGAGAMGSDKLGNKSLSHGIKSSSTSSLSQRVPNPIHKVGPGTNNVRVRTLDKYRTVYTDRQRLELEKEFRSHQFVTSERKAVLAGELQLTERQVKIWFQNRRAKSRKQEPTHRTMMRGAMAH